MIEFLSISEWWATPMFISIGMVTVIVLDWVTRGWASHILFFIGALLIIVFLVGMPILYTISLCSGVNNGQIIGMDNIDRHIAFNVAMVLMGMGLIVFCKHGIIDFA
jgi:hypothetical protein